MRKRILRVIREDISHECLPAREELPCSVRAYALYLYDPRYVDDDGLCHLHCVGTYWEPDAYDWELSDGDGLIDEEREWIDERCREHVWQYRLPDFFVEKEWVDWHDYDTFECMSGWTGWFKEAWQVACEFEYQWQWHTPRKHTR